MQDPVSLKRLEQGAKVLSRMDNPHLVKIIDYGTEPAPYIVMQYFSGKALSKWLIDKEVVDSASALEIFMQIADGLNSAHSLNIIHRDLKPANILVSEE